VRDAVAVTERTDAELVAACRAGDSRAWAELVERYSRYVYAIAVRAYRLGEADAEDVFQEVFARTYERLDDLRDDAAIKPWIAQTTRRLAVDHLRAAQREQPADVEAAEEPEDARAAVERLDDALAVRQALARLAPDCQEVLDRFFARDESYATIADAIGVAMGTVASRISRCLGALREQMEGRKPTAAPSRGR
jgi:RNA polymerase sigma factor (sigma-70 family)